MLKKNENIIERRIHDTFFLIDITQNYVDEKCRLYELNETGDFIWRAFDEFRDIPEVVNLVISSLVEDADYLEVYSDIERFVNILINQQFLEVLHGAD